jgi:transcription elongation GreA/GreB family factor
LQKISFKQQVHEALLKVLADKVARLEDNMKDLRASAANETKSTAGDKYETALAMLQTEQRNISIQLSELQQQLSVVKSLDLSIQKNINTGSLVKCGEDYFFISTGAGKITVEGKSIYALSSLSPLGKKLYGLIAGNAIELNNKKYKIDEVI